MLPLLAATAATVLLTSAQATLPPTVTCTGTTTADGPVQGRNKPCAFPFKYNSKNPAYSTCISFSTRSPQLHDITLPPTGTAYWCATTSNYLPSDAQKSKLWGFCNCTTSGSEYEGVPSAAPSSLPPSAAPEYEGAADLVTSGGYVPEDSACVFPLTFSDGTTYTSCIPFTAETPKKKGTGSSGKKPKNPSQGDKSTWCYAPPTAAPTPSGTINYSTLSKAEAVNWGYCRSTTPTTSPTSKAPTAKPSAAPPTVKPTTLPPATTPTTPKPTAAAPTTRAPTPKPTTASPTSPPPTQAPPSTSGGYVASGTPCKLPFVYVKPNGSKVTFNSCAPYASPSQPFVNPNNPPAQPTPPATNSTWCYTGTGSYALDDKTKRQLWGFCTPVTTVAPSTLAPTSIAPSAQPTTGTPTTTGQTNSPTNAPAVPTLAPVTLPPIATPAPSQPPNTGAPTTKAPTGQPTIVTLPPSVRPSNTTPSNTSAPTARPTNASGNATASPTNGASGRGAVASACVAALAAAVLAVAA